MFPFFFDSTMVIVIPGFLLAMWAQFKVKSTFRKWDKYSSRSGLTGAQVATDGRLAADGKRSEMLQHERSGTVVLQLRKLI